MAGGTKSTVPKYTIRVVLIWVMPVVGIFLGCYLVFPFVLAALLTPVELPKVRTFMFGNRAKKSLPCLRAPALMRLAVLWLLQLWWVIFWHAEMSLQPTDASFDSDTASAFAEGNSAGSSFTGNSWNPKMLSVVLPCAGEAEFALKTVHAVFDATPNEILQEIIVVDDGSQPPLSESHLPEDVRERYRVKIIRHETTVGLIGAKKDGGDAATGDIIVFFDCHVAPQQDWHTSFLRLVGENYRRIVVPVITDLDINTWRQKSGKHGQGKCYLTWDADFKWFESEDPYVPILSGGLLGISRRWWNETGGYDENMKGWGGENLDQSLRSWLCGGEIMLAKDSFVAHMWRVPSDRRTKARYQVSSDSATKNRLRAAMAWYGEFSDKLAHFPALRSADKAEGGGPWYGDISNILEVKKRLNCRSFAWFMKRFKNVYEDGGLVPKEIFTVQTSKGGDRCLTYMGEAGTSPDGRGRAELQTCDPHNNRQRWHGANRDTRSTGQSCCSGLRAWNTDQCIVGATDGVVHTAVCDISGKSAKEFWMLGEDGQLKESGDRLAGFMKGQACLEADERDSLKVRSCLSASEAATAQPWKKGHVEEPVESRLYRKGTIVGSDVAAVS
eukprot:TRINITY_DN30617_c0_g1_i1.p1 TRINITY_DN30617_c0_g1~~TRINITY_DN30617_c0_g1_i1.p1  ORF type:complete len:613 (-),score=123.14 TRINITY_DN30617_c0_g1_i1:221-2059(-)